MLQCSLLHVRYARGRPVRCFLPVLPHATDCFLPWPSLSAPKFQITPIGFSQPPNVLCPLSTLGSSYLDSFPPVYLGSSVLSFICRLKQQNISGHFPVLSGCFVVPLCSQCTLHVVLYLFFIPDWELFKCRSSTFSLSSTARSTWQVLSGWWGKAGLFEA